MTLPLRDYFNRSGSPQLGLGWMEENEHGFCVWRVEGEALVLADVYGDGPFWDTWGTDKAKELELSTIRFTTCRSPAAFVRKYGFEVVGTILERKL